MNQNLKNYNFYDFKLSQDQPSVKKNNLSIFEHYNVTANDSTIKPTCGCKDYLFSFFEDEAISSLNNNYSTLINSFILIKSYEYYDENLNQLKSILFALSSSYELYEISTSDYSITSFDIIFTKKPIIFENNQKIYFFAENDKFIYFDRNNIPIQVTNFINLESFCDFQGKSYFVISENPFSIYYGDAMEIENIDETTLSYESITVNANYGKILKVLKFKSYLYVIQQYAISKLAGNEENYYFNSNCTIGSKIYYSSIAMINDYVIFFASSGLYLFDGNEIKQIFLPITKKIHAGEDIKGFIYNNKYYLYSSIELEGEQKKVLIEFDVLQSKSSIIFYPNLIDCYCDLGLINYSLLLVTNSDSVYKINTLDSFSYNLERKYLKFNPLCFDDNIQKCISQIKIYSTGTFFLKIETESTSKIFKITDKISLNNLAISGYCFDIEIWSNDYFELKSIIFSVENIT